jgi:hypothetical protein
VLQAFYADIGVDAGLRQAIIADINGEGHHANDLWLCSADGDDRRSGYGK